MPIPYGWMIFLYLFTLILVWDLLKEFLRTIKDCVEAKAYKNAAYEALKNKEKEEEDQNDIRET